MIEKRSFKMKVEGLTLGELLVFHKSDKKTVIEEEFVLIKRGKFKIKNKLKADYSTFMLGGMVFEIDWKE